MVPDSADTEDEVLIQEDSGVVKKIDDSVITIHRKNTCMKRCCKVFLTFKNGWRIYFKQEIVLVGFSLASIYLTVLGFSGVTSAYFLTQGLRSDLIGVFQGVGAILGVLGTIVYPVLRRRFGTIRTGLFGISSQLLILLFCVAAIIVPSNRTSSEASGYYSPDCRNGTDMEVDLLMPTTEACISDGVHPTSAIAQSGSTSIPLPSNNSCSSSNSTSDGGSRIALILILTGVVGCRTGLWIFDLAVQQLVQEKVAEEERGVVGGVMNAMISVMDMLHYVLVIAAPRPEQFNILTAISFSMVCVGWLLYSIYVRKSRGHFFHFKDFFNCLSKWKHERRVMSVIEDNSDT